MSRDSIVTKPEPRASSEPRAISSVSLETNVGQAPVYRMPLRQGARRRNVLMLVSGIAIVGAAAILFAYFRSLDVARPASFEVTTSAGATLRLCEGKARGTDCKLLGTSGNDGKLAGETQSGKHRIVVERAGCETREVQATLVPKKPNTFAIGELVCTAPAPTPTPTVTPGAVPTTPPLAQQTKGVLTPEEKVEQKLPGAAAVGGEPAAEKDGAEPVAKAPKKPKKPKKPKPAAAAEKEEPEPAETKPVTTVVTPEPSPGTLDVNLKGAWAYVHIDGKNTGKPTPLVGMKLKPGRYRVTLVRDELGFFQEFMVVIAPSKTTRALRQYKPRD